MFKILYDKDVHEFVWLLYIFNTEWNECYKAKIFHMEIMYNCLQEEK